MRTTASAVGLSCLTLLTGCFLPYPSTGFAPESARRAAVAMPPYALPPDALVAFDHPVPGAATGATASFSYPSGILETYRFVLTLPGTFTFDGFTALGPAGTRIASYAIPTQGMSIPLRALTHDTAYADLYQNGTYEPGVDPRISYDGGGVFSATLPNGGDDQPLSTTASFDARSTFELLAGVLRAPQVAGDYALAATFTSVDPDGDGADDGTGTPPSSFTATRSLQVACATATDCDDGSPCTTDTCTAGACAHDGGGVVARLDCELAALLAADVCAPDAIAPAFGRTVRKKVGVARAALPKVERAIPKARNRLIGRMRRALEAIGKKASRSPKLTAACRTRFGTLVGTGVNSVNALLGS